MPGPAPKLPEQRRTRHKPRDGEWTPAPGTGWQHGKLPAAPTGIGRAAKAAWKDWFASWVASFWRPDDLSALRTAILLYDQMMDRPTAATASTLGQYLDRFGLTPAGRQKRRWLPPENAAPQTQEETPAASRYRGLKVVG